MKSSRKPGRAKPRRGAGPRAASGSRPFVMLNLAITADGKINTANRRVSSFSSRRDSEHMLELRATVDAVMSGARTVDLHSVTLGTGPAKYRRLRERRGLAPHPLRVVVSGSGSVDPKAVIFRRGTSPIIILTSRRATEARLAKLRPLVQEIKSFGSFELNIREALRWLCREWKVKRLLCEGGGELNDALFRAGLVDELHLTICPKIFGGWSAPTIADGLGLRSLSKAVRFRLRSSKRVGDELFLVFARR